MDYRDMKLTPDILKPVTAFQDQPQFVKAFSELVSASAGTVCAVCGLEQMGHGPESSWLGFERHPWQPIPADPDMIENARRLTGKAYRMRPVH